MMRLVVFAVAVCLVGADARAAGRQPCSTDAQQVPLTRRAVALTETQEADFGDAMAEHTPWLVDAEDDPAQEYLQAIGEAILRQLPPTAHRFTFRLVNLPEVNAFALPGGRIYVTRKMVAFLRSEDELAGLLGHEIGHVISRHSAATLTAVFRDVLGVRTFGDRADVFEKYRRLLHAGRESWPEDTRETQNQHEADRVALMAVARAGYDATAFVALWDRLAKTDGNTGSLLTDFFAATSPESRRLREMVRLLGKLPAGCADPASATRQGDFTSWRNQVLAGAPPRRAAPHRAVRNLALEPPLRSDLRHLRFSPDGRHLLAQDDASVYVLSREPLVTLFRIDAADATPAHFTPGSEEVVFATAGLRVERWNVARRERTSLHELYVREGCADVQLSPDGAILACIIPDLTLRLLDVASGDEIFTHGRFSHVGSIRIYRRPLTDVARASRVSSLTFSPEGRYLVVSDAAGCDVVDVQLRSLVDVSRDLRAALRQAFAFTGAGHVVTVDPKRPDRSALRGFPSGAIVRPLTLTGTVSAATRGEYVMLRPVQEWPVGVVDLASNTVIFASRSQAFDVFDGIQAAERSNGELALYPLATVTPSATVTLPKAPLPPLSAVDVTGDLRRIAFSTAGRGGVWDLESGARLAHLVGFRGAYLENDALYADVLPHTQLVDGKPAQQPRRLVRVELKPDGTAEGPPLGDAHLDVRNRFVLSVSAADPDRTDRDVTLQAQDVRDGRVLWTRSFAREIPWRYFDPASARVVLEWPAWTGTAREALGRLPGSKKRRGPARAGDAYLEVLDMADGSVLGRVFVSTGSEAARIVRVTSSGDVLVVTDRYNQSRVYTMSTGEARGAVFGWLAAVSERAGLAGVANDRGTLDLYDLGTVERLEVLRLGADVRAARFSRDGDRLLVLTSDQVSHFVDTAQIRRGSSRVGQPAP